VLCSTRGQWHLSKCDRPCSSRAVREGHRIAAHILGQGCKECPTCTPTLIRHWRLLHLRRGRCICIFCMHSHASLGLL
jgi:hypothetical protein